MSLGYAERLSYREDLGGQVGAPELFDSSHVFHAKTEMLAELVRKSKSIVAFTGAGISTASGIPDFRLRSLIQCTARGPQGVWTLQKARQTVPKPKISFAVAKPSLAHQALVALQREGKLKYVVSQNVDGLHLRSGIPRKQLAELHGNCFAEHCDKCKKEYNREFEIQTVGFKLTGRKCSQAGCNGALRDHILDWEDALPEEELNESESQASAADLAICLGTSLQVAPACDIPLLTTKAGKLVIVNLQATPKDKRADIVIHARADDVMERLLARLGIPIPDFVREHTLALHCCQELPQQRKLGASSVVRFFVTSPELRPFCRNPTVALPVADSLTVEATDSERTSFRPVSLGSQPFSFSRTLAVPAKLRLRFQLKLTEAADPNSRVINFEESFDLLGTDCSRSKNDLCNCISTKRITFTSQIVSYEKQELKASGRQCAVEADRGNDRKRRRMCRDS